MAVASGPAGPVLAGPVLAVAFTSAHAQVINNTVSCNCFSLTPATCDDDRNVTGGVA